LTLLNRKFSLAYREMKAKNWVLKRKLETGKLGELEKTTTPQFEKKGQRSKSTTAEVKVRRESLTSSNAQKEEISRVWWGESIGNSDLAMVAKRRP